MPGSRSNSQPRAVTPSLICSGSSHWVFPVLLCTKNGRPVDGSSSTSQSPRSVILSERPGDTAASAGGMSHSVAPETISAKYARPEPVSISTSYPIAFALETMLSGRSHWDCPVGRYTKNVRPELGSLSISQ